MENRKLSIAVCKNRKDKKYHNQKVAWPDLVKKLETTTYTHETLNEYRAMSKDRQSDIKDVGGFVGGYLKDGKRGKETVVSRSMITLDLDDASMDIVDDWDMLGSPGYAMVVYSTHKHTLKKPKLRLILPLSRDVDADEYEFIARTVAQQMDSSMLMFDDTTYQPSRMMFWPSTSKDGDYLYRVYDDTWLDVDAMLSRHPDWQDMSTWPYSNRVKELVIKRHKKFEDPHKKKGWIGAFNRTYTIQDAIGKFIPEVYTPTDKDDRWTYAEGSTAGGLVIYDSGKSAYSNHSTDPAADGHEHSSFDLVRIHKFGELDVDVKEGTRATSLPSYKAMVDMLQTDDETKITIAKEQAAELEEDFGEDLKETDTAWMAKLARDKNGNCRPTIGNASLILNNDPKLSNTIRLDTFSQLMVAVDDLPWRKVDRATRAFNDRDMASLRLYLERKYHMTGKGAIEDAYLDFLQDHEIHPVREKLNSLVWDGVPRAESIFIDFLGAQDTQYVRMVTRIFLRAAVMRVFHPGIKFDYMPILIGPQGIGKSTILAKLSMGWFNDSLKDFKGKEAMEQIQGSWFNEIGELAALRKSEVEDIKQFLSSREDKFRPAYGRKTELYPRQGVFIGTSNKPDIFRDMTGNRRFWPIDLEKDEAKKKRFFTEFDDVYVEQIWAEVMTWEGQQLYLPYEIEEQAEQIQKEHMETNIHAEKIRDYLDTLLPVDWEKWSIDDRREYYLDPKKIEEEGKVQREKVSIKELMIELFNVPEHQLDNYRAKEYNDIIRSFEDWEYKTSVRFYEPYGRGRGFQRKK